MWLNYPFITLGSFLVSLLLIAGLKNFSLKRNLLSQQKIPLVGGVGLGLSFILVSSAALFFYRSLSAQIIGIILSSGIMLVFGLLDDWRELSVLAKFLVQIIATAVLVCFGIRTKIIYIPTFLNIFLTFIWVLGITNAFNHLDIMDGVASGVACVVSLGFLAVTFFKGNTTCIILFLSLIGATAAFLVYNLPPARVYMGNSGSHFLGFVLAAIALFISYAPLKREVALLSPILILGFPLFDSGFLILMRLKRGIRIFNKSNDHLVLRFLRLGYSKKKSLFLSLLLCSFFSLCGVLLSQLSNFWGAVVVAFAIALSLPIAVKMSSLSLNG